MHISVTYRDVAICNGHFCMFLFKLADFAHHFVLQIIVLNFFSESFHLVCLLLMHKKADMPFPTKNELMICCELQQVLKGHQLMLNQAKKLESFSLLSLDGEIGIIKYFYFDDKHWAIRYVVVDTGNWIISKNVLLSPYSLSSVDSENKIIFIDSTKHQIESSPSTNSEDPISEEFEVDYYGFYGFPMYWGGPYMWGPSPYIVRDRNLWKKFSNGEKAWNPNLRSTREVSGYEIHAADGEIGHVVDFIIDDETWAIRYLVIDTQNWWPGKKVLLSPLWIERVSWSESQVFVKMSRSTIKESPEFIEEDMFNREYEIKLHQHYNHQGYWVE